MYIHLDKKWKGLSQTLDIIVTVHEGDDKKVKRYQVGKANQFPECPAEAMLLLNPGIAAAIGSQLKTNIEKYADAVTDMEITLSERYVTIRFNEQPTPNALEQLLHSDKGFRRYFAVRRGLAVPPLIPTNYGIEIALFSVVATMAKIHRRFHLSPDGVHCHDELAVPYVREKGEAM